jgi:hypothetical protein
MALTQGNKTSATDEPEAVPWCVRISWRVPLCHLAGIAVVGLNLLDSSSACDICALVTKPPHH